MGDIRLAGTFAYKWTQIKKNTRHTSIVQYLYLKKANRKRIQSSKRDVESSKNSFSDATQKREASAGSSKNTRKERLEMPQPFELAVTFSKIQNKKY